MRVDYSLPTKSSLPTFGTRPSTPIYHMQSLPSLGPQCEILSGLKSTIPSPRQGGLGFCHSTSRIRWCQTLGPCDPSFLSPRQILHSWPPIGIRTPEDLLIPLGDGLIWVPPPKIVWFLKNIFLVRKKYWKITKTRWCYRGMVVVVYIVLNKEFLAHIKWVTCKSHIVRRVLGGTHIRPSPHCLNNIRLVWYGTWPSSAAWFSTVTKIC
jgi:hypothetical protein